MYVERCSIDVAYRYIEQLNMSRRGDVDAKVYIGGLPHDATSQEVRKFARVLRAGLSAGLGLLNMGDSNGLNDLGRNVCYDALVSCLLTFPLLWLHMPGNARARVQHAIGAKWCSSPAWSSMLLSDEGSPPPPGLIAFVTLFGIPTSRAA